MSTVPEPTSSPLSGLRALTRWGIPFRYVPAAGVIAVGIALLLNGGLLGLLGGWVLAAALPIAIGAFLRDPRYALLPAAVWAVWLIATSGASEDAALSNTPVMIAVALAAVGSGATLVAQRAILPAMEPGAWGPTASRRVPTLDADAPTAPPLDHSADHTIELAVVEPIEASDEELRSANADAAPDPTFTAEAADEVAVAAPPAAEVPLDADPASLDEGGHVVEFSAISEVDLPGRPTDEGVAPRAAVASGLADGSAPAEPQLSRRRARRQG